MRHLASLAADCFALAAANLPFVNERLLVVGPRRAPKAFGWRLVELALLALAAYGLGAALEARIGQRAPQGWQFFAAAGWSASRFRR